MLSGDALSKPLRSYRDPQEVDLDSQLIESERVVHRIHARHPAILTDQRLLGVGIDRDSRYRAVSLYPGSVGMVCRIEGKKGRGDLELSTVSGGADRRGVGLSNGCKGVLLKNISDVRAIERAIREVLFTPDETARKHHRQHGNPAALTDSRLFEELAEGERLVWADRPVVWRLIRNPALFTGFFGLFWIGCAGVLTWRGLTQPDEIAESRALVLVLGVLFILIGILPLLTPYWLWKSAKGTLFAITDRRCLHIIPRIEGYSEVASYYPRAVTLKKSGKRSRPLWQIERMPRLGSLDFGTVGAMQSARPVTDAAGFDALPDPAAVERLIREVLIDGTKPERP